MLSDLKTIVPLLSSRQRKHLLLTQGLVVASAVFELVGVGSILPFMRVATTPLSDHATIPLLPPLLEAVGADPAMHAVLAMGLLALLFLTLASTVTMAASWATSRVSFRIGAELGSNLFDYYMHQPLAFHLSHHSSTLASRITAELERVTHQAIHSVLIIISRVVLVLVLLAALTAYRPAITLIGAATFVLAYLIIFKVIRRLVHENGKVISEMQRMRHKTIAEGLGGIKDAIQLGREAYFSRHFSTANLHYGKALGTNTALAQVPRSGIELIAYGSVIALVLLLVYGESEQSLGLLPLLSLYALAGLKLLPALQQIYNAYVNLRSSHGAFSAIVSDLQALASQHTNTKPGHTTSLSAPRHAISMRNIVFSYPGSKHSVLEGVDLTVPVGKIVGIVGPSGTGKSTLIDILLGFHRPQSGEILLDDTPLRAQDLPAWRQMVGYVPQSVFLTDGSVAQNVAFGLDQADIDLQRVSAVLETVQLLSWVESTPEKLDRKLGERGAQLSGGQRQRIGIARALYNDPAILVFDEATSALDRATESAFLACLQACAAGKTVLIIAHRQETLAICDEIHEIT